MKNSTLATVIAVTAVVIGGLLVIAARASQSIVNFESENAVTDGTSLQTNAEASAGSYLEFNDSSQPPPSLRVGLTLTHDSADIRAPNLWNSSVKPRLASDGNVFINTHIHGFGMISPAIDEGQPYDWSTLDQRIQNMRDAGAEPIITLCCSPGWMNGSAEDFDFRAPLDEHFDDFAQLSAAVAQRYPDVEYFQVWNELKGFFNGSLNRWDYERYTRFYNDIYTAVKQVRPDAKLGGPYVVMESWVTPPGVGSEVNGPWGNVDQRALDVVSYWLDNNVGADFVAVDGGGCPTVSKNPTVTSCDGMTEAERHQFFRAVAEWLDEQTDLPIWWSEVYPAMLQNSGSESYKTTTALNALDAFAAGGGDVALLWSEECNVNTGYRFISLWSCDNGQMFDLYDQLQDSDKFEF